MNTTRKWQLIFSAVAFVIAAGAYLLFAGSRNTPAGQVAAPPAPFGTGHYNVMKTDTFVALVQNAYGQLATTSVADNILVIDMPDANELAKDFFNGNDALLRFGMSDHGFEIRYNPETKSLKASFKINERRGINVPNDVLIKLMDKTVKSNSNVNN